MYLSNQVPARQAAGIEGRQAPGLQVMDPLEAARAWD
jgi:hypothetical protein